MTKTTYDKDYVVRWTGQEIVSEHDSLAKAKRLARQMGPEFLQGHYTGPTAYVGVIPAEVGQMCVLYNPVFREHHS